MATSEAAAHFSRANALYSQRRHDEALASYDRALALEPDFAQALNNRGSALMQLQRHEEALASYDRALSLRPEYAQALNNRAVTLQNLKRHDEALVSLGRALAIERDYVDALYNRGTVLHDLYRLDEALASYDRALSLRPDHAEALNNRGNALQGLERFEEALASYDRALSLMPAFVEALYNRGNTLRSLKRLEDALASYDRALSLAPDHAPALNNRGYTLQELRRFEEALSSYDRALSLNPDDAQALSHRGNALQDLKRFEEAVASYERALALEPDYPEALNNRGNALRALKRYEEAAHSYARLLALAPGYHFAKGKLLRARMACCDWEQFAPLTQSIETDILGAKIAAEPSEYLGISSSARALQRCAELYAAQNFPSAEIHPRARERRHRDKIRIGYVSGEFRQHATSYLMAELFERHDRNRFEVFAFDNGWDDASAIRARIAKAFDRVLDISRMADLEAAETIQRTRIDILVDLNGYYGLGRPGVFSHKPCPVQVGYLGFPGTVGAAYLDYILADAHVIPPDHQQFYTEKVVYLPDSYQVSDSTRAVPERTPAQRDAMLPDTGFVFCCFNNNYKITPNVFDVWMRLLNNVPGSVLWLLEDTPMAGRNLRREAGERGIAPDRLVFAARVVLEAHLSRHRCADLFLDTLPYNAHTTAGDALWAGLPLLTCMGSTFPGRVGGSLLSAVGLPELITHSLDHYEALALKLATTPAMLSEIRAKLERNRTTCPLFDTDRFRRHIESAYVGMWERYQHGKPFESFAV